MDASEKLFLQILKTFFHNIAPDYEIDQDNDSWKGVIRLSNAHSLLPVIVQTTWNTSKTIGHRDFLVKKAKQLNMLQAQRTADFLCLYRYLTERGLKPAVLKGIVCRSLYPYPEQRSSVDEDLLIRPDDIYAYHQAMLDYGMEPENTDADLETSHELTYIHKDYHLYIEIHKSLFPEDSEAYGELNHFFSEALNRVEPVEIYGQELMTLFPTDHLLYMIFHAYKHFLHSGVGIRHVCDIGIFAENYRERIDWKYILQCCREVHLEAFTSTLFSITERDLGFRFPEVFRLYELEREDLLEDILSGGLYGTNDINRAHSAEITLSAVAAGKEGKRKNSIIRTVFLPLQKMKGKYPVLKRHPWLLPAAWTHRILNYLIPKNKSPRIKPMESVRIGKSRIELLREYKII